ncbi:hypothetical protein NL676_021010 [Syzygium grande]|nr:hypothetical protein NL676_021010 [Syzygium grande]
MQLTRLDSNFKNCSGQALSVGFLPSRASRVLLTALSDVAKPPRRPSLTMSAMLSSPLPPSASAATGGSGTNSAGSPSAGPGPPRLAVDPAGRSPPLG